MTKNEYLLQLKNELKKRQIEDADEILMEYEQHFDYKLDEGYTEEEIAVKLGTPKELAGQFEKSSIQKTEGSALRKTLAAVALPFEVIGGIFFLLWIIVMAAGSIASLGMGICLITGTNIGGWIPAMPYLSAVFFAICFFAFALLLGGAVYYCFILLNHLIKAMAQWHKNIFSNRPHPSVSIEGLDRKTRRRFHKVIRWFLVGFGIAFVLAFLIAAIQAGGVAFWHIWGWFSA